MKEGLKPCYTVVAGIYQKGDYDAVACDWSANGYRLPNEAEWEKAARGGLVGNDYPWGDSISHGRANYRKDTTPSKLTGLWYELLDKALPGRTATKEITARVLHSKLFKLTIFNPTEDAIRERINWPDSRSDTDKYPWEPSNSPQQAAKPKRQQVARSPRPTIFNFIPPVLRPFAASRFNLLRSSPELQKGARGLGAGELRFEGGC